MAPYINDEPIEPVDEALEAPLKSKPQLIAPEPGESLYAHAIIIN